MIEMYAFLAVLPKVVSTATIVKTKSILDFVKFTLVGIPYTVLDALLIYIHNRGVYILGGTLESSKIT